MDQIDSVTHPLVGDAGGEVTVEPELEIGSWIEGAARFVQQPLFPVRILFANLLDFGAAPPSGTVIIPDDLDLGDVAHCAAVDELLSFDLVGLATVLSANLNNAIGLHE